MKRLLPFLVLLLCSYAAWSHTATETATTQTTPSTTSQSSDRLFFPKNWYWGWAQFGGRNAPCSAFARYQISGNLELHPIGRTVARRLMVFYEPNFLFGNNLPQVRYTWSWTGIGMEVKWGVGLDLPKRFQFRYTNHPTIVRFGSRDQPLGGAWLGANGPWGQY